MPAMIRGSSLGGEVHPAHPDTYTALVCNMTADIGFIEYVNGKYMGYINDVYICEDESYDKVFDYIARIPRLIEFSFLYLN